MLLRGHIGGVDAQQENALNACCLYASVLSCSQLLFWRVRVCVEKHVCGVVLQETHRRGGCPVGECRKGVLSVRASAVLQPPSILAYRRMCGKACL